jgi:hypothetical protein
MSTSEHGIWAAAIQCITDKKMKRRDHSVPARRGHCCPARVLFECKSVRSTRCYKKAELSGR